MSGSFRHTDDACAVRYQRLKKEDSENSLQLCPGQRNQPTGSVGSVRAKRGSPLLLLDHLVSAREQGGWRLEAERLGSLEVDHEIEPRGLFDRQVAGICAVQDL